MIDRQLSVLRRQARAEHQCRGARARPGEARRGEGRGRGDAEAGEGGACERTAYGASAAGWRKDCHGALPCHAASASPSPVSALTGAVSRGRAQLPRRRRGQELAADAGMPRRRRADAARRPKVRSSSRARRERARPASSRARAAHGGRAFGLRADARLQAGGARAGRSLARRRERRLRQQGFRYRGHASPTRRAAIAFAPSCRRSIPAARATSRQGRRRRTGRS